MRIASRASRFALLAGVLWTLAPASAFAQATKAVTVTWDANKEENLAGYILMLGSTPGDPQVEIDVGLATSYDLPAGPGARHFVWVHAYNNWKLMSLPSRVVEIPLEPVPPGDIDLDGLPEPWEQAFGIDDPWADPDGDGVNSYVEWQHGTDPTLPNHVSLAEGSIGGFESSTMLVNPSAELASGTITLHFPDGAERTSAFSVAPRTAIQADAGQAEPGASRMSVSIDVTRGGVGVDRTMRWIGPGFTTPSAGLASRGSSTPSKLWVFGEGDASTSYDTYFAVLNDNGTDAQVTFQFFRDATTTPVMHTIVAGARSRATFFADEQLDLKSKRFWVRVVSDVPIVVERTIYISRPGKPLVGGHTTAGAPAASRTWYFAEGQTGTVFDTWLYLTNPQSSAATVDITYLRPSQSPLRQRKTVFKSSRTKLRVDSVYGLSETPLAIVISSTLPIYAERSVYWPGSTFQWYEGHSSVGLMQPGTRWLLAGGRIGGSDNFETEIAVGNPDRAAASLAFTFLRESGEPIVLSRTAPAQSRFTLNAAEAGLSPGERFGVIVDSSVPVVVERSTYWDANGIERRGGTNETGIRMR